MDYGRSMRKQRSIVVLLCGLAAGMAMGELPDGREADRLAEAIKARVEKAVGPFSAPSVSVLAFEAVATNAMWKEFWPAGTTDVERAVEAPLWDASIRASLEKHNVVYFPARPR